MNENYFSNTLINWYESNKRDLPWRNTIDPYKIWISEIILQQTRVKQGLPYYNKFVTTFPSIKDLANANEEEVLKLWQGLGYYSRARNMHKSAKYIQNELNGVFPTNYIDIKKLKGVGEYTAAAISSFCFKEKKAVLDGNVYRLLSRFFGIETPIDSSKGKKEFTELLEHLISTDKPDIFNQSIMEFGAIQCTPKSPNCSVCHWQEKCVANNTNKVHFLPIKSKKIKQRIRYFNYIVYKKDKNYFIQKRTKKDIWENMYEFPLLETKAEITDLPMKQIENGYINSIKKFTHLLSHQKIFVTFWVIHLEKYVNSNQYVVVNKNTINDYPFPKIVENYIKNEL
jgi:A/G-specific adenine glycosylase